ncbi:hypothetical protein H312_01804 [Anncaliia algerae PRA339]|uniref:Extracellular membrane protein CFEM domain-containing protein n=1 Tax=Anncaliia algerae PRA339 TaxID=1288291 RepID=A0A059F111_9MICR|nr:hypothetical protein H312_01804 [Anncaliia algerae PRA339]
MFKLQFFIFLIASVITTENIPLITNPTNQNPAIPFESSGMNIEYSTEPEYQDIEKCGNQENSFRSIILDHFNCWCDTIFKTNISKNTLCNDNTDCGSEQIDICNLNETLLSNNCNSSVVEKYFPKVIQAFNSGAVQNISKGTVENRNEDGLYDATTLIYSILCVLILIMLLILCCFFTFVLYKKYRKTDYTGVNPNDNEAINDQNIELKNI